MKFFLTFCFILTLCSLTVARSVAWGKRKPTDHLLYRENVLQFPIKNFIQEYFVSYPKLGSKPTGTNVTAIYIFDRFTNSSGAVPIRGIPLKKSNNERFNSTVVILRSQRSKGINSTVEFYGQ